jgi:putative nucleotidyltransferase with HDIG domain
MANGKVARQITGGLTRGFSTVRDWLVRPSMHIHEPGKWRDARLLSVFVLSLFILFLIVNLSYLFTVPGYAIPPADLIGYAFLLAIYLISRTRLTNLAVILMLLMFPLNVFMNVLGDTSLNITATLLFLIPSYVIASIFLRVSGLVIYGMSVTLMIGLIPVISPGSQHGYTDILGPVAVSTIVVVLLVIAVVHRNYIEQDRQAELREAYDHALESWSRALELRDKDTEGHSRRVAELTVELAKMCGMKGRSLEHVFRGALLHDIGKMSIPDVILQKPRALSKKEWELMHQHPTVAMNMLAGIPFLAPAIEIPLNHHENWDGSGYPNHLAGEGIPLAARIFTLVDTWDALTSNRPYRAAWSRADATKYIHEQSGIKFDPAITPKFIKLLRRHKLT